MRNDKVEVVNEGRGEAAGVIGSGVEIVFKVTAEANADVIARGCV